MEGLSELQGELFRESQAASEVKVTAPEEVEIGSNELDSESGGEFFSELPSSPLKTKTLEQIQLVPAEKIEEPIGEPLNQLQPMKAVDLSMRLGVYKDTVASTRSRFKNRPDQFKSWLRERDPDRIAWEYREETKLYHPVVEDHLSD